MGARAISLSARPLLAPRPSSLTVDVPAFGRREADERNRFALPPGVAMVHFGAAAPARDPAAGDRSVMAAAVNTALDPAFSWDDLDWLASLSPLPILLKGILHPDDAVRAVNFGARAILVSNHGGRQLDSAVAALDALPAVAEAVAGCMEVLVDGGVRRGTDVLKALALGARAVLLGRPIQWGLAVGGEAGVRHVLELLRAELERDLLLCGVASPGRGGSIPARPIPRTQPGVKPALCSAGLVPIWLRLLRAIQDRAVCGEADHTQPAARAGCRRAGQSALPGRSPEQSASAEWAGSPLEKGTPGDWGHVPVQARQSAQGGRCFLPTIYYVCSSLMRARNRFHTRDPSRAVTLRRARRHPARR